MHRSTRRAAQIFTSIEIDDTRARLRAPRTDVATRPSTGTTAGVVDLRRYQNPVDEASIREIHPPRSTRSRYG